MPMLRTLEVPRLERSSRDTFRKVSASFSESTGIGSDRCHLRIWTQLSDEAVDAVIEYLYAVESSLYWPEQASLISYFLFDKQGGGKRPIGLLASLVRVWERLRKPYANEWLAAHPRAYDWASKGKTSEMAVWAQMIEDESLDIDREPGEDDEAAITAMLDLIKASEKIRMRDLVEAAMRWEFPVQLLRVMVSIFSMPRRVVSRVSYSRQLQVFSATVAGSTYGTVALRFLLMAPLDDLVTKWHLKPFLYVDDLALQVRGSWQQVARYASSSTKHLVLELGSIQHLPVSGGVGEKSVYISAHVALAREVASDMGELGIYPVTTTKLLGIDRHTNAR